MSESGVMQCGLAEDRWNLYFLRGERCNGSRYVDSGVYYRKSSGAMAVSEWVDYTRYYVDERGIWAH